jgi:hypothetical protein
VLDAVGLWPGDLTLWRWPAAAARRAPVMVVVATAVHARIEERKVRVSSVTGSAELRRPIARVTVPRGSIARGERSKRSPDFPVDRVGAA